MARIYISHSAKDEEVVHYLRRQLMEDGHDIIRPAHVELGKQWRAELEREILHADVTIAIFSEHSMHSKWFDQEFSMLRGFTSELSDRTLFLPIVIGDAPIPVDIRNYQYLRVNEADRSSFEDTIAQVRKTIGAFIGRRTATREEKEEKKAVVEAKASTFMAEAMKNLTAREESFSKKANLWYGLGYASLLLGVLASGVLAFISMKNSTGNDWALAVIWGIKSVLILGLMVALSKYAFTLGKSFMAESLKNADRKHAISFGNFFMDAFSDSVRPEDVKEVFQDWNMTDANSGFEKSTSSDFDPKIIEQFTKFVESVKK